jgi:hypothetical protein
VSAGRYRGLPGRGWDAPLEDLAGSFTCHGLSRDLERVSGIQLSIGTHQERVALGFVQVPGAETGMGDERGPGDDYRSVWFDLPNKVPIGHFEVDAEDVRGVLTDARTAGLSGLPRMLAHSHYSRLGPSSRDIEMFPNWLLGDEGIGLVYHTPTQLWTAYNGSGVLSAEDRRVQRAIATVVGDA